jgi:hypothetical protein
MSIRGYNVNPQINKLALDETLKITNLKMDQLISVSGGDTQALEDIKIEIELTNEQLETIDTTLQLGNQNTSQANEKLDNIIEEAELLKRQEVENSTDYDFDIFSEVIVPRLPTPPPNEYIRDPFKRNAWYLQNVNAGATQLYWYATDAPFGFKSNSVLTLGQVIEGGGFYFALYLDKVDASLSLPILGVYTTPTGSGDAVPGFYKSRVNYGIATNQKLFAGELIVCYNSITILDKIKNVLPTARRVLLTQTSSVGTAGNDETIRYMTINNDSLTPLNDVRWAIVGAGWYDGSLTAPVLRHFRFTTSQEIGNAVSDETTHDKLDTTNDKLTDANNKLVDIHNDLIDVEGLIEDVKEVLGESKTIQEAIDTKAGDLIIGVDTLSTQLDTTNNNTLNSANYLDVIRGEIQDTNTYLVNIQRRAYNSVQPILDWFNLNRLISVSCISTPTDVGSMVGGWSGNHISFRNIPQGIQYDFEVVSSNANDSALGTGCQAVFVYGLNSALEPITENVSLSGTSPITLTKQFNHINLMYPLSYGSGEAVAGEVVIRSKPPSPLVATQYATLGSNQHSSGWFKCPAGYKAILQSVNYTSNNSGSIMTICLVKPNDGSYTIIGRYDCGTRLELNQPIWVLNPGDSVYMFQTNAFTSKGVMTFELVPLTNV